MTNTRPKPFVFVLMPFDSAFTDAYKLAIKPACDAAGTYAERVDEQIFQDSILQRIYNQIAKADVIVADMTGRNPNVFYETGYSHALGKQVILLTQRAEDIPFDLQHYPHIVYGGKLFELRLELERRVRHAVESAADSVVDEAAVVEVAIGKQQLGRGDNIIDVPLVNGRHLELEVTLYNSPERFARVVQCQIALITPNDFTGAASEKLTTSMFRINPFRNGHLLGRQLRLLPGVARPHVRLLDE